MAQRVVAYKYTVVNTHKYACHIKRCICADTYARAHTIFHACTRTIIKAFNIWLQSTKLFSSKSG